jgi:uncharacterized protein YndB with AHSA1/START domain
MPKTESAPTATERAVFKVFIRGSIDAVWNEITKTDSAQLCMFDMMLVTPGLAPGRPIQMRAKNGKSVGVVGEVLEFDPPHRYAHTFKFTHLNDPPCKVFYDLKPVVGGVEFTLTLEDVPSGTKTAKSMVPGGKMIVDTLKALVETGKPPFRVRLLYAMFTVMAPFTTPKVCAVENWPLQK